MGAHFLASPFNQRETRRNASQQAHPYFDLEIEEVEGAVVASYSTGWKVRDVEVDTSDGVAYLACKQGVETVDIADPTDPARLVRNHTPKKARSLSLLGRWLAVGRGPGMWSLAVLDTNDPGLPVAGAAPSVGMGRNLVSKGRAVYAAQGLFGIKVYDVDQPEAPQVVQSFDSDGPVLAVARAGEMLYSGHMKLGCWSENGIDIFDISEGTQADPPKVGEVTTAGTPVALKVIGDKLLVAELEKRRDVMRCFAGVSCHPPESVEVFDISDPQAPVLVTELSFDAAKRLFGELSGRWVFAGDESGFEVTGEVVP